MSQSRLIDFLKEQNFHVINYNFRFATNDGWRDVRDSKCTVWTHSSTVKNIVSHITQLKISHHDVLFLDPKFGNVLHYFLLGDLYKLPRPSAYPFVNPGVTYCDNIKNNITTWNQLPYKNAVIQG